MSHCEENSDSPECNSVLHEFQDVFDNFLDCLKQYDKKGLVPSQFKGPLRVQIEITSNCNLNCVHCYNESGPEAFESLTAMDLKQLVIDIAEMGVLEVSITGGEPLVEKDNLFILLDDLQQKEIGVKLITNGCLIDDRFAASLAGYKNIHDVQVSLDGSQPSTHDVIRRAPGSWEKALNGLKMLIDKDIPVSVGSVFMRHNYTEIGELIDLCFYIGAKGISFGDILHKGRALDSLADLSLDDAQYNAVFKTIQEKEKQYRGMMKIVFAIDPGLGIELVSRTPNWFCVVRANGDVCSSCILSDPVGNIREQSLKNIWSEKLQARNEDPAYIAAVKDVSSRYKGLGFDAR